MDQIAKEQNQMWLLKLPDFLYKALQNTEGKLGMEFNPKSGDMQLHLSSSLAEATGGVGKFSGKLVPVDEPLYVFSVDSRKRAQIRSKVIGKTSLNPEMSLSYDQLARSRFMTSTEGISTTELTSDLTKAKRRVFKLHEDQMMYTMSNTSKAAEIEARRRVGEKRVRGDKAEVQEQLFELFKSQRYWKLKALANETDQPEAFLAEILADVAVKETQGTYRNHWKLKPEYCSDSEEPEPSKRLCT